jgi:hypothetical protein
MDITIKQNHNKMGRDRRFKIIIFLISILTIACYSQEKKKLGEADEFLKAIENKNVEIFYDLFLIPRKFNKEHNRYHLGRLVAEFSVNGKREQINLPIIREKMSNSEVAALPFYNNVKAYSLRKAITIDSAKRHITKVVSLYDELNVIEIVSHPDLGRFIRFKIDTKNELVYKEREADVYHNYWKDYFKTALKLNDKWYFRNISK